MKNNINFQYVCLHASTNISFTNGWAPTAAKNSVWGPRAGIIVICTISYLKKSDAMAKP